MKPGSKEYHALKSREWYQRTKQHSPERIKERDEYNKQRRKDCKSSWVKRFGGVCLHCQQTYPDCVFEFHHVNHSEKEYSPSHLFGLSIKTQERELSKCVMLCANCHRIEHDNLKYDAHAKRILK